MNFVEQYRKYFLIVIILIVGIAIFIKATPFISGILGAMTFYVLLRGQMKKLTEEKKLKKALAACLLIVEVVLFFLLPAVFILTILINKLSTFHFDVNILIQPIESFATTIKAKTGYNILKPDNLSELVKVMPEIGQYLLNSVSSFFLNVMVMLFILYFMLVGREPMEKYIYELLPFSDENKKTVLSETNIIVKSNAIGIPLLAVIQGCIALLGYYIFDVPNAFLFGLITCVATIIPLVGTAIIWIPLAVYLLIQQEWGNAIGLAAYGMLVITQVDNLIRFVMQKQMANIHPLITIFGVFIGLPLFGFMGVIFGPLLLSMFLLCVNIFKKEYLNTSS
ncbi:AI-2E family transporter [Bacteroides sp. 214]|uniref:AI-2E family transporter n=1 Tax=Bacteroides sp. 214 TaxID=2302935 RepID=UPI0013D287C8|nr:AI-2E family transporter [Bacteroides sp. 214]NDW11339.1 AI-2E family transporter [Bacteroides sp. 214]